MFQFAGEITTPLLNHPGLNQFQRNQKSVQDKNGSKNNTKNQSNGKSRGNKSAKRGNKNSKKQRKGRKPAKTFIPPEPSVPDLPLNIEQRGKKSLKSENERKSKQEIIPNGIPISEYLPPPPPQIELGLVPFINGFFETTTIVSNI